MMMITTNTADMIKEARLDYEITSKKRAINGTRCESQRWKMLIELEKMKIEHSKLKIKMFKYKIKQMEK